MKGSLNNDALGHPIADIKNLSTLLKGVWGLHEHKGFGIKFSSLY